MGQNPANHQVPNKTGSMCGLGDSPAVAGEVNGKQCYITVDTGSNMSIVRPDFIGREISTQLEGCWMRTVTGERAPIRGRWSSDRENFD